MWSYQTTASLCSWWCGFGSWQSFSVQLYQTTASLCGFSSWQSFSVHYEADDVASAADSRSVFTMKLMMWFQQLTVLQCSLWSWWCGFSSWQSFSVLLYQTTASLCSWWCGFSSWQSFSVHYVADDVGSAADSRSVFTMKLMMWVQQLAVLQCSVVLVGRHQCGLWPCEQ